MRTVRNAVSRTLEEESIISQELVDEIDVYKRQTKSCTPSSTVWDCP